jgi:3-deoxy-7-phosphoheptulonate synthase
MDEPYFMTSRLLHYPGTKCQPLPTPHDIKNEFPLKSELYTKIEGFRQEIIDILQKKTKKTLFIVGPCSIHDTTAAFEFASKLKKLSDYVSDTIALVMRVYCEKPRTVLGWKGLLYDPNLDNSNDIAKGIRMTRELMLEINRLGVAVGTEFLDPLTCHYYHDLVSWGCIGARTSSSQIHRQFISGLSIPVGFKNSTDGNILNAVYGMNAANHAQCHIGLDDYGRACAMNTSGNPNTHLVLRGGERRPNFNRPSVAYALELLATHKLPLRVLIDCSHDNSGKDHEQQPEVVEQVVEQICQGNENILGLVLESYLNPGRQKHTSPSALKYGISITDGCMDWNTTEEIILRAHARFSKSEAALSSTFASVD